MGLSETEINLQQQVLALQQKLEAREDAFRNFKNVFRNAVDPILLISGGTFIDCNKAAVDILGGKKKEDVLSTHPSDLSPEYQLDGQSSFEKANKMIELAFDSGFHRFEWTHRKLNGELFPVEVSLTRIELRGDVVLYTLWKDLTDQKRDEQHLHNVIEKLEKANQAKTEFLSRMSHELRTPLNAILGFTQVLQMSMVDSPQSPQALNLDQILKSGYHLLDLINDVLDLSRVEAGSIQIQLKPVSLEGLLADCLSMSKALIGKRSGIEVVSKASVSSEQLLLVDEVRIKEVLSNLISNAIKYSPNGGLITFACEKQADNMMRISVTDSGMGISEKQQPLIFEPFARLGAESLGIEGSGIGLTITKKLVELMSGRIGFTSEEGKGSCFWVDVPIHEALAPQVNDDDKPEPDAVDSGVTAKVLYVEDNRANAILVQNILARFEGITLTLSMTAEEGLGKVKELRPDLILLDINLPGMSGWEALTHIQGMPEAAGTPVIALTASASQEDIKRGAEAGFYSYLTKPLDVQQFSMVMIDALKSHQTR